MNAKSDSKAHLTSKLSCTACLALLPLIAIACSAPLTASKAPAGHNVPARAVHAITGFKDRITAIAFSPNGRILAIADGTGAVTLYDGNTRRLIRALTGKTGAGALAFSPDGRSLASDGIDIWQVDTGRLVRSLHGHKGEVTIQSLMYDSAKGDVPETHKYPASVTAISYSADGKWIASASDDETIEIWSTGAGRCARILKGHKDAVYTVDFAPQATLLASGSEDGTVRIWDAVNGRMLRTIKANVSSVHAAHFSPDGKTVACIGLYGSGTVWSVSTGRFIRKIATDAGPDTVFSSDGRRFANVNREHSPGDTWGTAAIRDATNGKELRDLDVVAPDASALSAKGDVLTVGGVEYNKKYKQGHRYIVQLWPLK